MKREGSRSTVVLLPHVFLAGCSKSACHSVNQRTWFNARLVLFEHLQFYIQQSSGISICFLSMQIFAVKRVKRRTFYMAEMLCSRLRQSSVFESSDFVRAHFDFESGNIFVEG